MVRRLFSGQDGSVQCEPLRFRGQRRDGQGMDESHELLVPGLAGHRVPRPFTYEEELLGQYQEPEEFTNFADGLTATAALRRVGEVRALRPAGHGHW